MSGVKGAVGVLAAGVFGTETFDPSVLASAVERHRSKVTSFSITVCQFSVCFRDVSCRGAWQQNTGHPQNVSLVLNAVAFDKKLI